MKYALLHKLILLAVIVLFANCKKEDDYVYPSVITEFMLAESNSAGNISYLRSDEGGVYRASNGDRVKGLTPDSLYRVYCVYELSKEVEGAVTLYSVQNILSPDPIKANLIIGGVKTDPLSVQSVWRGGDYINLSLQVMAQDTKKHRFHFIDYGITTKADDKELNLTLYHDQGGDLEAYNQLVYLSVPLRNYRSRMSEGDSILFKINTFKGFVTYTLKY